MIFDNNIDISPKGCLAVYVVRVFAPVCIHESVVHVLVSVSVGGGTCVVCSSVRGV